MHIPQPTAVFFDLDGTLVDSSADLTAAGNVARQAVGLPALPLATVMTYVGDGVGKLLERLIPDASQLDAARQAFMAHYADHCADQTQCYPHLTEVVQRLFHASIPMAVVTNKPQSFAQHIINERGLANYFTLVIGGDGPRKPAPEQLLSAAEACQVRPEECLMIGDHHTDILAAQAAGSTALWVAWGLGHPGECKDYHSCQQPEHLLHLVQQWLPQQ